MNLLAIGISRANSSRESRRLDRSGTLVLSVKSARLSLLAKPGRPSSSIFDDLDLGSTRKPGPKAKLPVPVEGGLVRSPREVRGR